MTDEAKRICDKLRNYKVAVNNGKILLSDVIVLNQAANLIERLSAELEAAKPGWISVEDRLPDNDRPVITYDAAGFMWTEIYDYSRSKNLSLYERAYWTGHIPFGSPVTHWMPMPKPPKDSGLCAENGGERDESD